MREVLKRIMACALVGAMALTMATTGTTVKASETEDNTSETATVVAPSHEITLCSDGKGSIALDGVEGREVGEGETVQVTVTPCDGYVSNTLALLDTATGEVLAQEVNVEDDGLFTFTMPKQDITVSATFVPAEDKAEDSTSDVETYIKEHINEEYATYDEARIANAMAVKHTLCDSTMVSEGMTFEDVYSTVENGNATVMGQYENAVIVYDVDSDSDYYIAFANTMLNDSSVQCLCAVFAKYDLTGTVYDGCIYDRETGLVYVPKQLYANEDGTEEYARVQVQFMQSYNIGGLNQSAISVEVENNNKKIDTVDSVAVMANAFADTVTVPVVNADDAGKITADDITVYVNDMPTETEDFVYDETTGEITLEETAIAVSNVRVEIAKQESFFGSVLSAIFPVQIVNAMSADELSLYPADWACFENIDPDDLAVGQRWDFSLYVRYGDSAGTSFAGIDYAYCVGFDDESLISLANIIFNGQDNYDLSYSEIEENQYTDFAVQTPRGTGTEYFSGVTANFSGIQDSLDGYIGLQCADVVKYSFTLPDDWNAGVTSGEYCKVGMRILDVNTDADQPYVVCGIMTSRITTQAGVGVYKFAIPESKGYASLKKTSANPSMTDGNSCYDLAGATYGVYSDESCTEQVATMTTDSDGNTDTVELKKGNYYVKEISAPKGYYLDEEVYPITVNAKETTTLEVEDNPMNDPAGITLQKIDQDTSDGSAQGAASLAGAQFEINYYDNLDGDTSGTPLKTWVIETKYLEDNGLYYARLNDKYKVSGDDFYYDEFGTVVLPLGTYEVTEIKAPEGYLLDGAYFTSASTGETINGTTYVSVVADEDDGIRLDGGNEYAMSDRVIRGDFSLRKIDANTQNALGEVSFRLTDLATGESHIFTTDQNGYYDSSSDWNKHSYDTNGGKADSGLWFGEKAEVDDERGALPYGTYLIEELEGDNNVGKKMYTGTVTIYKDSYDVSLYNIENYDIEIHTTATDGATLTKDGSGGSSVTMIDTVEYEGLPPGQTYELEMHVYVPDTETLLTDDNGDLVTGTATFVPDSEDGTVEVTVTFDTSNLEGDFDLVAFEKLYKITTDEDGNEEKTEVANHEDPTDEGQTVHYVTPSIHTTAVDGATLTKDGTGGTSVTMIDTVEYEGLTPGKTYELEMHVYVPDTETLLTDDNGDLVTGTATFVPEESTGSVEVTVTFDTSNLGEDFDLVAFEKCYEFTTDEDGNEEKTEIANHEDPTDEGQTVHYTDIEISGNIDKKQTIVGDGDTYYYTIDYCSTSNTWADELNMTDPLESVNAGYTRLEELQTPVSFDDYDGKMNVWYQTNLNDKSDTTDADAYNACSTNPYNPENPDNERMSDYTGWKLWKAEVSTLASETLTVVDLGLSDGEYVTAIRFEHGRVEENFTTRDDGNSVLDEEKSTSDNIDSVVTPHGSTFNLSDAANEALREEQEIHYAPVVLKMSLLDPETYQQGGVELVNSAYMDIYRNKGISAKLYDDDEDKVVQTYGDVVTTTTTTKTTTKTYTAPKTGITTYGIPLLIAGGILLVTGITVLVKSRKKRVKAFKI